MSPTHARYADMLQALLRPGSFPFPVNEVTHLHTHISDIFLAGDFAYKTKKPVDLGFLDFTSPEKRLAVCRDEVRLNARLAPEIYLGVSCICLQEGRYYISDTDCGADITVDHAVRMRRLPQDGMLDRLAAEGRLTRGHMLDIAGQVARFHLDSDHGTGMAGYGSTDSIAAPIRQNFRQTEKQIGTGITREQFERLRDYSESFLRDQAALFRERITARRIVDGHGDLHLRNMCLYQGRVVIFDCIEFSLALRAGDAISDIAFLAMDLDARALPHLGNTFLNAYLEKTGDYRGVALLDFYQIYRACVRAKVSAFLVDSAETTAERDAAQRDAGSYFSLAETYLAQRPAGLIITCGLSGSGKTTAACAMAERIGAIVVRSDAVRKHLAGMDLQQRVDTGFAQGIYNPEMTRTTYSTMLRHACTIAATGRWAILDATYPTAEFRKAVADAARDMGLPFAILYCTAPREELIRRLALRESRADDISDATSAILDEQARHFGMPAPEEGRILRCSGTRDIDTLIRELKD
jgi:hypothetical protein